MLIKNLIAFTVKTLSFELFPVSFSYVYIIMKLICTSYDFRAQITIN